MLRALIIEDEPLARQIIREYLEKYTEIDIIGECIDGFDGVKKITELKPSLIFLDIQMPKINGFENLNSNPWVFVYEFERTDASFT